MSQNDYIPPLFDFLLSRISGIDDQRLFFVSSYFHYIIKDALCPLLFQEEWEKSVVKGNREKKSQDHDIYATALFDFAACDS